MSSEDYIFNPEHRAGFESAVKSVFDRYFAVVADVLSRYPTTPNHLGIHTTDEPVTAADRRTIIEERRFAMEALRTQLPDILEKYPRFLKPEEMQIRRPGRRHGYGKNLIFKDSCLGIYAYALAFGPHQETPIHTHPGGVISFGVGPRSDLIETTFDDQDNAVSALLRYGTVSTFSSPHQEQSRVDKHVVGSTGLYPVNMLLNICDGLEFNAADRLKFSVSDNPRAPSPTGIRKYTPRSIDSNKANLMLWRGEEDKQR